MGMGEVGGIVVYPPVGPFLLRWKEGVDETYLIPLGFGGLGGG